jgi:hypothetical protein
MVTAKDWLGATCALLDPQWTDHVGRVRCAPDHAAEIIRTLTIPERKGFGEL